MVTDTRLDPVRRARPEVFVVAVGCTAFGKHRERGFRDLARQALDLLVADAGPESGAAVATELDSLWFGNCFMHGWGQPNVRGQMTLVDLVDEGRLPRRLPVTNVEAACATGSTALMGAVRDVLSGEVELSMALGVEKLVPASAGDPDPLELLAGCSDHLSPDRFVDTYRRAANGIGRELVLGPDRSLFMDTYATQALLHMAEYGTTREQIAAGCAKNHNYGAANPLAQYRFTTTVEQVLADREVSHPLTRSMCSPIGDGAAAALVCSGGWLRRQPEAVRQRAVRVRAMAAVGGTYGRTATQPTLSHEAARRAYRHAGIGPADVDVAEVHDATSFGEILQVEMLGFCEPGQGGAFIADGATGPGGTVPVNTSGGLVSKGHPPGATGLSMIYELTRQLRGEAGERQVPGARIGLAENGGGVLGLEEATCVVTVLEGTS